MKIGDLAQRLYDGKLSSPETRLPNLASRQPVHVIYGGADKFPLETPGKFGRLALKSLETYGPNFVEFANAFWLPGCDSLPVYEDVIADLEFELIESSEKVKGENFPAWLAWTVYNRTIEKIRREPVEDFRIDFEDGYGIRSGQDLTS